MDFKRFIIAKPDLDTVFTALLLGWREGAEVRLIPGQAPPEVLSDPAVFCIECGGSGQMALGNFDHHNTPLSLPPACLQALHWQEPADPLLWEWADYVAAVDLGQGERYRTRGWSLSQLFSGLRLALPDSRAQLAAGVTLLQTVLNLRLRPGEPLPLLPIWEPYRQAKAALWDRLTALLPQATYFETRAGRRGGSLSTPYSGVHGLLRRQGCEITIAQGLRQSDGPIITIASPRVDLRPLLAHLNRLEPGWGGPANGRIIASPPQGSSLPLPRLLTLIAEVL